MILIPTLVFWIFNPKSIFEEIWSENFKAIWFAWKLVDLNSFLGKLESKKLNSPHCPHFASIKLWNKIKLHVNLYIMGCPFSMYTIISMYTETLSYSRATNICWMENNPDGKGAFSSSLRRGIVTHNHLPFFTTFANLVHFCPNFHILPFLNIFWPFLWKITCMPLLSRIGLK